MLIGVLFQNTGNQSNHQQVNGKQIVVHLYSEMQHSNKKTDSHKMGEYQKHILSKRRQKKG